MTLPRPFPQASSTSAQPQPPPALLEARGCESPTPPETLPLPPAPGLALHGNSPVSGSAPGFGKDTATKKGAGRRASVPTSKAVEATAGSAKAAWSLSGEEAALPAEGAPMGKMGTVSGQGLNDSFTATAARLEWIERQGKRGGAMDMEVSGISIYFWVRHASLHLWLRRDGAGKIGPHGIS